MSFQNPFNSIPVLNTVTLDVDNCEDDFEEFNEDNWLPSTMNNQQLWDENWDDTDNLLAIHVKEDNRKEGHHRNQESIDTIAFI